MHILLQWNGKFLDLNHVGICSIERQNKMVHKGPIHVKLASAKTTSGLLVTEQCSGKHPVNELRLHHCVSGPHPQLGSLEAMANLVNKTKQNKIKC